MPETVTKQELVGEAARLGITERQIDRWRKVGLLPRPTRRGQGQGAGMASDYPAHVLANLQAIQEHIRPKEPLWLIGWRLWWRGYDVQPKLISTALEESSKCLIEGMQQFAELYGDEHQEENAEALHAHKKRLMRLPMMRSTRNTLGRSNCGELLAAVGRICAGETAGSGEQVGAVYAHTTLSMFNQEAQQAAVQVLGDAPLNTEETREVLGELDPQVLAEQVSSDTRSAAEFARSEAPKLLAIILSLFNDTARTELQSVLDSKFGPAITCSLTFGLAQQFSWYRPGVDALSSAFESPM